MTRASVKSGDRSPALRRPHDSMCWWREGVLRNGSGAEGEGEGRGGEGTFKGGIECI